MRHPTAQGINDLGIIDAYVRFAKGNQPTQAQFDEVKKELSIPDKIWNMYQSKKSGAFLPNDVRDNILDVVSGTYNTKARMVNPDLSAQKAIVQKNYGDRLMEEQLPHEYPILRTRTEIETEIDQLAEQGMQFAAAKREALLKGDTKLAKQLQDQYTQAVEDAKQKQKELGALKAKNWLPDYSVLYGHFGWTPGSVGKAPPAAYITQ